MNWIESRVAQSRDPQGAGTKKIHDNIVGFFMPASQLKINLKKMHTLTRAKPTDINKAAFKASFLLAQEAIRENNSVKIISSVIDKANIVLETDDNNHQAKHKACMNLKNEIKKMRLAIEGEPFFRNAKWNTRLRHFLYWMGAVAGIVLFFGSIACPPLIAPTVVLFGAVGYGAYKDRHRVQSQEEKLSQNAAKALSNISAC